ncbi:type IV secretory system conjugative DNA transfer family protein [Hydrogenophaga taeniospiralis]|uniref:type IV secretory system conjugative DNA transfer family protein n=1 Tax=Hydrogenophaga taeniospiralis TaxID=65656 RepID=UPI001CFC4155|nr:type IV secretory system conjugative DNA transfer family protein [Hydrogenophaga taeniospiralis]MCB4365470.1 type IV secretory system conjugative DNA transfer family protein [Hydrogenophaga taeniospiralis]
MTPSLTLPMASWSTPRKVAAYVFTAVLLALLILVTLYLSGALFLLLIKADLRMARWNSFTDYWQLYGDDPMLRQRLLLALGMASFGTLVVLPGMLWAASRPRRALHGSARFASLSEVKSAGLLLNEEGINPPSILIGRFRGHFLALPGQLSVMLSAPTRSGKGVGVVVPNLLNWPDSVVVLDIKGENFAITAGYRAKHQQAVYAFSPFDEEARSHRWNPLTAVRNSPLHRVGDLLGIGQVFFPNDGSGTSSEAFFNDQARNLFLGLGLLLLETPGLPRTIGEMLRQSSGQGQPLKTHLSRLIQQRQDANDPFSDECVDALQRLLCNSENTLASVVATFHAPLIIFADAVVDAATSADDFDLSHLRRQRMSIYVRIPPHRLANARPLLNLFFSQLVSLNTQHLPAQNKSLKYQCLLVNDEFTAMGRVGIITHSAAFLAGYNLRLLTVVQAMSQLDATYGEKEARTFATNHGLQILFAPREQRDADEYSAMLGHFTERVTTRGISRSFSGHGHRTVSRNESEQRRALLLPQEFKELGRDRLVVICENCKPILGEKIRYFQDKAFKARLLPAPKVEPMRMELHQAKTQQRWRIAEDELPPDKKTLRIEDMAHDIEILKDKLEGSAEEAAQTCIDFFCQFDGPEADGGTIEPADEADSAPDPATPTVAPVKEPLRLETLGENP